MNRERTGWPGFALVASFCCVANMGCQGTGEGFPTAPQIGAGGASGPGDGSAGSAGVVVQACTAGGVQPTYLRRLSGRELGASVQAALGVDVSDLLASLPSDLASDGYDNNAELQSVSPQHVEAYAALARQAAERLLQSATLVSSMGCDVDSGGAPCVSSAVQRLGRRLFRRSLSGKELESVLALAGARRSDPRQQLGFAVQALLQSPKFLFMVELGRNEGEAELQLTGPELATRLAFFLTGRGPDDALLDVAENAGLDGAQGLAQAAAQLFDTQVATVFRAELAEQWLQTDQIDNLVRSTARYPELTQTLRVAIRDELKLLAGEFLGSEQPVLGMYTAGHTYLNDELAQLYGLTPPGSRSLVRVELDTGSDRAGILGTAAVLFASTPTDRPSVVHRGKFVRKHVLCDAVPAPPEIPPVEVAAGQSPEAALKAHSSQPACAGCHLYLDPIGKGLDRYDAIGKRRSNDEAGEPVDQVGHVEGIPDSDFGGAAELGHVVANAELAAACVVEQSYGFALGRTPNAGGADDSCWLAELNATFGQGNRSYRSLVLALASSKQFATKLRQAP